MILSINVAVSENGVIGVDNQLPWHLPADLKYFRQLTTGHTVIMGRKTYESIGKALPNRENLVITWDMAFRAAEGVLICHSLEEALHQVREQQGEVFIIGGDMLYRQSMGRAERLYLTRVHTRIENGTAFFPEPDTEEWKLVQSSYLPADEKNALACTFEVYDRIHTGTA